MQNNFLLSLFTGGGLLDIAFRKEGFYTVSAGDIITANDIRDFHAPKGKFDGIIGGSPCQDFSGLRRTEPTGNGLAMLNEFKRVVLEASPKWFLLENVARVPSLEIDGYQIQRFTLSPHQCGGVQSRTRAFQFGHKNGHLLDIKKDKFTGIKAPCLTASEGRQAERREWGDFCELQGLDRNFKFEGLSTALSYKLVGNGVNVLVGRRIAAAIREVSSGTNERTFTDSKTCQNCGAILRGRSDKKTCSLVCRKNLSVKGRRDKMCA